MWVQSLGWEDPLEKGVATYSSILAWRIPWAEKPGGRPSRGLQRVRHDRSDLAHLQARMGGMSPILGWIVRKLLVSSVEEVSMERWGQRWPPVDGGVIGR